MTTELSAPANSAVSLIQQAIADKVDPAYLRELLAVRQAWEADEARKAFNAAVADFQREAPIIEKGDKAYDKAYARMDRIWREIRPLLTRLGLSVTWQVCELRGEGADMLCHVEGQLRHRDGHGERLVQDIPMPELIKGQNKAQQMGSASTYARRYAMCAALGLVTGDDDDGHAAATHLIDASEAKEINDLISACEGLASFNKKAFWGWVGCQSADQIPVSRLADVLAALKRKLKEGK